MGDEVASSSTADRVSNTGRSKARAVPWTNREAIAARGQSSLGSRYWLTVVRKEMCIPWCRKTEGRRQKAEGRRQLPTNPAGVSRRWKKQNCFQFGDNQGVLASIRFCFLGEGRKAEGRSMPCSRSGPRRCPELVEGRPTCRRGRRQ